MSTLFSAKNDDVEVSPIAVGSAVLFFTLVIAALIYLSDYSMGSDFANEAPHFQGNILATSQE